MIQVTDPLRVEGLDRIWLVNLFGGTVVFTETDEAIVNAFKAARDGDSPTPRYVVRGPYVDEHKAALKVREAYHRGVEATKYKPPYPPCSNCKGKGYFPDDMNHDCTVCDGTGYDIP